MNCCRVARILIHEKIYTQNSDCHAMNHIQTVYFFFSYKQNHLLLYVFRTPFWLCVELAKKISCLLIECQLVPQLPIIHATNAL